jgi:hypothetical protein
VATCDRLLADLDCGREQLNSRSVLVVDEAGMLGSRKLARLLEHAQQARAKVVLVGDDRQPAAIDAGGGFRALRLRLGPAELTENRRQHQAWEREALELVRSGLVEEAVAAYRAHDRVVAAESKPAATLALLEDWWQAYQEAEQDPAQDVIVLAGRRAEVDRLNTACQQLLAARGRLGPDRLQVEGLQLAVGDRVVCGRNAIAQLGVANGTRGTVAALDPGARTLTIRVDGKQPREVVLPCWYLDGGRRGSVTAGWIWPMPARPAAGPAACPWAGAGGLVGRPRSTAIPRRRLTARRNRMLCTYIVEVGQPPRLQWRRLGVVAAPRRGADGIDRSIRIARELLDHRVC